MPTVLGTHLAVTSKSNMQHMMSYQETTLIELCKIFLPAW